MVPKGRPRERKIVADIMCHSLLLAILTVFFFQCVFTGHCWFSVGLPFQQLQKRQSRFYCLGNNERCTVQSITFAHCALVRWGPPTNLPTIYYIFYIVSLGVGVSVCVCGAGLCCVTQANVDSNENNSKTTNEENRDTNILSCNVTSNGLGMFSIKSRAFLVVK